ncbi:MAG: hypothetical protein J07HX5_00009 [halophilic archaeon J07HX5]|nr:MAG: hypothetical protein J07HX5_00009 [halophilic archaeon J07HX5]
MTRAGPGHIFLVHTINKDVMFFGSISNKTGKSTELSSVEFPVPRLTPVPRIVTAAFVSST